MDRTEKENLDGETERIVKDHLKRPVYDVNWSTVDPLWQRYKGLWCSKMTPRVVAYVFCSCFPEEGLLYAQLVRDAGSTYEMVYGIIARAEGARVLGEELEQKLAA